MVDATDAKKMPLLEHLIELRQRLFYSIIALVLAFLVCFALSEWLFDFLAQPLTNLLIEIGQDPTYYYTHLLEKFFTHVKVAFFFAAFFTCPMFLTQLWLFVAPGLYKNEKQAFLPFLIVAPLLFFTGGALVYFLIMPLAFEFFISFQRDASEGLAAVELLPKVNEYFSLVMALIFAFGLCFQLPVIMTLLARVGLATSEGMAAKRKYAILGVFIVAAIFTPPDPISQISLAIPIVLLYEVSIHVARLVEKKRAEKEAADEAEALSD